jgi:L-tartrate/succinate antiporter
VEPRSTIVGGKVPQPKKNAWRALLPLVIAGIVMLLPRPAGLEPRAWIYAALFAGVVAGLILEPIAPAVLGLIGVSVAAGFGLVPGAGKPADGIKWLLSGFADPTVWLIFGAFVFSLGFERSGLGRRLALLLVRRLGGSALGLGYAIAAADLVLAPLMPSNAARTGGIIVSVIRPIPPLYGSEPGPTARRFGAYLFATSFAVTAITSSMFLTALAPNILAVSLVQKATGIEMSWIAWFRGALPVGVLLLALTPWLLHRLYPPEIRSSHQVPIWAAAQLRGMGPVSRREMTMAALSLLALALWIFAGAVIGPTQTMIVTVCLMVILGVVSWDEVLGHRPAWNMLVWFATLVTLADGLAQVGLVGWMARGVSHAGAALPPATLMVVLVAFFFLVHYLFASSTAHATALLPVMLATGAAVPALPMRPFALLLCYALGLMGVISPYASGPAPIFYGSGFIPRRDFWLLGLGLGLLYLIALIGVGVPYLLLGKA